MLKLESLYAHFLEWKRDRAIRRLDRARARRRNSKDPGSQENDDRVGNAAREVEILNDTLKTK